jgi:hypothetical protein
MTEKKLKDINELDKILSDEGLISRCYKNKEEGDNEYRCVIKSDDEIISEIDFSIKETDEKIKYAYIDLVNNFYSIQIGRKKRDKQKHIYVVGAHIIFKAVIKAKKLGAKYILLLPMDSGSGKLFKYYKKLGFKCSSDRLNTTDYPDGLLDDPTIHEWYVNCYFMIGYINDILKHCCKAIEYRDDKKIKD